MPEVDCAIKAIREKVLGRYGIATTASYGPGYLHSAGELHKGGPNSGLFLQLSVDQDSDVEIPGRPYTFSTFTEAQAIGDFQSLQDAGRPIGRAHLGLDEAGGIFELVNEIL